MTKNCIDFDFFGENYGFDHSGIIFFLSLSPILTNYNKSSILVSTNKYRGFHEEKNDKKSSYKTNC